MSEATENTDNTETGEAKPDPALDPKPEKEERGTSFIDFKTATPEQIEARFKRLYGNMKENERVIEGLREHNNKLAERLDRIEIGQGAKDHAVELAQLKGQLRQAKESGNTEAEVDLTARIATLKPRQVQQTKMEVPQARGIDVQIVEEWSAETDAEGNFTRPWAHAAHPRYAQAYEYLRQAAHDPQFGGDIDKMLAATDKFMGMKARKAATVLSSSSDGGPRRSSGGGKLTSAQEREAMKLGVKPEAYRKQLEAIRAEEAEIAKIRGAAND